MNQSSKPQRFSNQPVDWSPFSICKEGEKAPYPRSLQTPEGLGDRLRFVAFAEKQATLAFSSAAKIFVDAPDTVKSIWLELAKEEEKHLNWLLERMRELNVDVAARPQSLALWKSFDRCETPKQFADFMASAEERGRVAGEQFYETLLKIDPITAKLFQQIAIEEHDHILLAQKVFDYLPRLLPTTAETASAAIRLGE